MSKSLLSHLLFAYEISVPPRVFFYFTKERSLSFFLSGCMQSHARRCCLWGALQGGGGLSAGSSPPVVSFPLFSVAVETKKAKVRMKMKTKRKKKTTGQWGVFYSLFRPDGSKKIYLSIYRLIYGECHHISLFFEWSMCLCSREKWRDDSSARRSFFVPFSERRLSFFLSFKEMKASLKTARFHPYSERVLLSSFLFPPWCADAAVGTGVVGACILSCFLSLSLLSRLCMLSSSLSIAFSFSLFLLHFPLYYDAFSLCWLLLLSSSLFFHHLSFSFSFFLISLFLFSLSLSLSLSLAFLYLSLWSFYAFF